MNPTTLACRLRDAANKQLESIIQRLPTEPSARFVWFLEIQRVFDVRAVQKCGRTKAQTVAEVSFFEVLQLGMNLAAVHLLFRLKEPFGLPLGASTDETREAATRLLYSFGLVGLARRTADMIEHGFMVAEVEGETIILRDSGMCAIQFLDKMELDSLARTESELEKCELSSQGWNVRAGDDLESIRATGAFWARPQQPEIGRLLGPDQLRDLMLPLIKPWKVPQGTLMGYDAIPEVDEHFLNEAALVAAALRDEAGIHPDTDFGKYNGSDLLQVVWVLLSFYRKHIVFGLLARRHIPEIDVRDSFTIWGPHSELIDTVSDVLGMPRGKVKAVMGALTLTPRDIVALEKETTPLLPMLVDLGNGFSLRPVSSMLRSPLVSFHTIARWRKSSSRNAIAVSRESWMRKDIYSLFGGRRYICVSGNVVLRTKKIKVTDVDAAVFDCTNGELALFQIKWQDYFTNNVREQRSKAGNLASELDAWAKSVVSWVSGTPSDKVAQAFRLKLRGPQRITSLFLFGISRAVSRPEGYGFPVTDPLLSVASWPQLKRVRLEIGPAPSVIGRMHEVFRVEEEAGLLGVTPIPVEMEIQGLRIRYEDMWNTYDASSPTTGV